MTDAVAVNLCAVCKKHSISQCGRCGNGLDRDGAVVPMSYYCSKDCQLKYWPIHKTSCKAASQRLRLYRAADMIQFAIMAAAELSFPLELDIVMVPKDGAYRGKSLLLVCRTPELAM
jgi:hypothetical protein